MTTETNNTGITSFTFTFGFGHACVCGLSLGSCYTHIEGESLEHARVRMASLWDRKWAFSYVSDEEAGVERHGLTRIVSNFDDPALCPCSRSRAAPRLSDERCASIRREIDAMRQAQHAVYGIGLRVEAHELQAFAPLLSAYADLAEAALELGVDYKLATIEELAPVAERVAHKGRYFGEKFGRLFGPWLRASPAMRKLFMQASGLEDAARDTAEEES